MLVLCNELLEESHQLSFVLPVLECICSDDFVSELGTSDVGFKLDPEGGGDIS